MSYLLDTNVVINYLDASLPESGLKLLSRIVDDEPIISIISKIETLGYDFKSSDEQVIMETFINSSLVLSLNDAVVDKTIEIRKKKKIKLPDAIIAATALVNGLILVSRNIADFKDIDGLKIIDPGK